MNEIEFGHLHTRVVFFGVETKALVVLIIPPSIKHTLSC